MRLKVSGFRFQVSGFRCFPVIRNLTPDTKPRVSPSGYPGDSTTGIPARKEPGGYAYVKHGFFTEERKDFIFLFDRFLAIFAIFCLKCVSAPGYPVRFAPVVGLYRAAIENTKIKSNLKIKDENDDKK